MEYMALNQQDSHNNQIKTVNNNILKCVDDYKYIGSYIRDSGKDFKIRKALAWSACNNMDKIWRFKLVRKIKS